MMLVLSHGKLLAGSSHQQLWTATLTSPRSPRACQPATLHQPAQAEYTSAKRPRPSTFSQ